VETVTLATLVAAFAGNKSAIIFLEKIAGQLFTSSATSLS
jgi:hypothetical protein